MTEQEAAEREAIRHLMTRYNINGDRGRVDALAATFAVDGTIEFSGEATKGRAAIAARLTRGPRSGSGSAAKLTVTRHHLTTSLVEIDGTNASARTYFQVLTDIGLDHQGVYVDRLVKTGTEWLFAHRQVRIDWQAPNSLFPPLHVRGRAPLSGSAG